MKKKRVSELPPADNFYANVDTSCQEIKNKEIAEKLKKETRLRETSSSIH